MPSPSDKLRGKVATPTQIASGTPELHIPSSQDHDFKLQYLMEIQRALGKLEGSVSLITESSKIHLAKLDKVNEDVISGKGMAKAFGWILSVIGAIALVFLGSILTVLLKHFKLI